MYPNDTTQEIPYGYCQCGCGQKTPIAKKTRKGLGHTKGQPVHYIPGHTSQILPVGQRFWRYVDAKAFDQCWLWEGAMTAYGYGKIGDGAQTKNAHRVSWEIHFGPIPEGLYVCHRCDNKKCVNPYHLFLGTHSDNMKDMYAKGLRTHTPPILRGEDRPQSKLTTEDVLRIRELAGQGISQRIIAEQFGITRQTVSSIFRRRLWAHIP